MAQRRTPKATSNGNGNGAAAAAGDGNGKKKGRGRNPFRGVLERLSEDHLLRVEVGALEDMEASTTLVRVPIEEEDDAVYEVKLVKLR